MEAGEFATKQFERVDRETAAPFNPVRPKTIEEAMVAIDIHIREKAALRDELMQLEYEIELLKEMARNMLKRVKRC